VDFAITVITFGLTWFLAGFIGGAIAALIGMPVRRFGGFGLIAGFVDVTIGWTIFNWLGRDPTWVCVAIVAGAVLNDAHRFVSRLSFLDHPRGKEVVRQQALDLIGIVPGGLLAWWLWN
jgi:hypothetical protein